MLTMFTDLWSQHNWALPPGVPKLGSLLHPGSSQRLFLTLTCTYTQVQHRSVQRTKVAHSADTAARLFNMLGGCCTHCSLACMGAPMQR